VVGTAKKKISLYINIIKKVIKELKFFNLKSCHLLFSLTESNYFGFAGQKNDLRLYKSHNFHKIAGLTIYQLA